MEKYRQFADGGRGTRDAGRGASALLRTPRFSLERPRLSEELGSIPSSHHGRITRPMSIDRGY